MNTTELLGIFRAEVFDLELPYLWSDELVYTYIDDAQKWFCRLTYGIEDARSFQVKIVGDSATVWYDLDPMILKLRDAYDSVTGDPIDLIAAEKLHENGVKFDGSVGPVKALITGLEKNVLRAYPIPNIASTVDLYTFRLPYTVGKGDNFEIDEQHHLNLLMWVKYRAYSVQDGEARDDKKAAQNKADFEAYCARAKVEQSRQRRPVSTVTYGGY